MDALVALPKPRFLPSVAEHVSHLFPEFGGRVLAVSEVSVTKDNVPTLPLAMVAFTRGTADPPAHSSHDLIEIVDQFLIEFWLEPERYKRANGTETPFWGYYDYEGIRDRLLTGLGRWEAPGGERIAFRELTIEAEQLAVILTFRFTATFRWCPTVVPLGDKFTIDFKLCTASVCCIPEEVDPCQ